MAEMGEFVIYENAEQYEARARSDSKVAEAVLRELGMYGMNN